MAWPKLRNRRSAVAAPTFSSGGGIGVSGTGPQEPAPDQTGTPSWRGHQGWADRHATVTPASGEAPEAADPLDAPFWESWAPADQSIELDDPDDGLPEDGPADDAVTDVDPRPRPSPSRSREPVVTPVAGPEDVPKAEGIGQRLGNFAHLSANPRMRAWQRRVIVAVIAGLVFGILLHDWRWGVTFAVLAAITDTIIRSRTTFNGPAGVRLTRAQKATVRQLGSLERKGYRTMHILPIPNSDEQIDHLVIGPAGVFAIDSEDWDKRMPVRTSSHRQLWHGPRNMKDRLEHAHWEADQAADLLSAAMGSPVTVRAVLAVYGPKIMWDVAEIRDVDTFSGPRLRKYLRRRAKKRGAHLLSESEIERIDKAAHQAFPQAPTADPASR
jgi:Nuclease-related domain